MAELTSITSLSLSENEYCYTVSDESYTSDSFRIRISKFMPLLNGNATISKVYYNRNIFVNDNSCMPTPENFITYQNYLTVKRAPTCTLYNKTNSNGILPSGTTVRCTCMNNNIKDLRITDVL